MVIDEARDRLVGDYAYVSDCHSSALVSRGGSIDWCCMPRLDSGSVFGRLLDHKRGGFCAIGPIDASANSSRRYLGGTLVLETSFQSSSGEAHLLDCFTMRSGGAEHPYRQLLRVVEGTRGWLEFDLAVVARFDYGEVEPWVRRRGVGLYTAIGGNDALVIFCDADLERDGQHDLRARFAIRAGQRVHLSITYANPADLERGLPEPARPGELDRRLEQTLEWWRTWSSKILLDSPDAAAARRSAIVLKEVRPFR
jgi:GH15 family glucan-1,4-alpha-glucosidase